MLISNIKNEMNGSSIKSFVGTALSASPHLSKHGDFTSSVVRRNANSIPYRYDTAY